jgi:hypothetical protein
MQKKIDFKKLKLIKDYSTIKVLIDLSVECRVSLIKAFFTLYRNDGGARLIETYFLKDAW